jgi:hypothetical protein
MAAHGAEASLATQTAMTASPPGLALGYGRNGASCDAPAAQAERPLSDRSGDALAGAPRVTASRRERPFGRPLGKRVKATLSCPS